MPENRLTILTYHAVDERPAVISVTPAAFRRQMGQLSRRGIRGISLENAFHHHEQTGGFPEHAVVLTFDDGYRSIFEHALPTLREQGFAATVFVSTDFVGLDETRAKQLNTDLDRDMMNWRMLQTLCSAGFEIGAHSKSHPDLTRLNGQQLEDETGNCKRILEEQLGTVVDSFAFPYGYWNERVKEQVARFYHRACTTKLGHNAPVPDPLLMNRIDAFYLGHALKFIKVAEGGLSNWLAFRQSLRNARSLAQKYRTRIRR